MKNKIVALSAVTIAFGMSGCMGISASPTTPTVVEKNITKEVLIPHNDNVKKAVAILISKVNAIEKYKDINNSKVSENTKELNTSSIMGLDSRLVEHDAEIKSLRDELMLMKKECCQKGASQKRNLSTDSVKAVSPAQPTVSDTASNGENASKYDPVIKEFIEGGPLK